MAVFHPYHTVGDVGLWLRSLGYHTQPVGIRSNEASQHATIFTGARPWGYNVIQVDTP